MNIFEWLARNGYKYTWNFGLADNVPDIIAFNHEEVVVFETKRTIQEMEGSLDQCLKYAEYANKIYLLVPAKVAENLTLETKRALEKGGIGLVQLNGSIEKIIEAKSFFHDNKGLIRILEERVFDERYLTPSDIKNKIIEILKANHEGMPISYMAKISGLHRQTLAKYLQQLRTSDIIKIRNSGTAKLCYLNSRSYD